MRSNNPVFNRSEAFNGQGRTAADPYAGYGNPSEWGVGEQPLQPAPVRRMTIDSVVQKTGITLGVVVVLAMATWIWAGDLVDSTSAARLSSALLIGSGGAFVLSLVNSFKKNVSPALVLAFAAFEGVALGALSKFFDGMLPESGIVTNAVLGTLAAFAGTLAAYKYFNIQLSDKFKRGVVAVMFGMVGLSVLSLVLSFAGIDMGLFGAGPIGILFAVVGLVMGVFMLLMDFDFVEQGIRHGIDEKYSWTAAFAMTVSLVWIYTNLLRLLAIFQQD